MRVLNCRSAGSHGFPGNAKKTPEFRERATPDPPGGAVLGGLPPTFGAGADAAQGAGAAAAVLALVVGVAELPRGGAVRQPHLDVGQVPPVGAGRQRDVPHPRRHQRAHVLPRPARRHRGPGGGTARDNGGRWTPPGDVGD